MTATEIVMKRIGIEEAEACYYVDLAVMRVRSYLNDNTVKPSDYLFPIVSIATLLYEIDASTKNAKASFGYQSVSMSEGGVSKSEAGMTGSDIIDKYENAIMTILENLSGSEVKFI